MKRKTRVTALRRTYDNGPALMVYYTYYNMNKRISAYIRTARERRLCVTVMCAGLHEAEEQRRSTPGI